MSELGGNEEGVGGRAESLNFFEVILSSSRENHLGEKNHFFSLCPPTPVNLGVLGELPQEPHWGKAVLSSWPGNHTSQLGKLETFGITSQEKAETSINNTPQSCCETSH